MAQRTGSPSEVSQALLGQPGQCARKNLTWGPSTEQLAPVLLCGQNMDQQSMETSGTIITSVYGAAARWRPGEWGPPSIERTCFLLCHVKTQLGS